MKPQASKMIPSLPGYFHGIYNTRPRQHILQETKLDEKSTANQNDLGSLETRDRKNAIPGTVHTFI